MNEDNGKHEFNFFLDKELQQKLLEANEDLLEKEFAAFTSQNTGLQSLVSTNKNNNGGAQQSHKLPKYLDCVHVCGWCPNPNTVYRKSESQNDTPPRSRGHLAVTRESLFSRDSKSRPQNVHNFVFRHYSDPRKYIEQYRKEHACYDSTNSSATKNEFLETRRFYAYNQYSPLAVGSNANSVLQQTHSFVPQPQLDPPLQTNDTITKSHNQQTPSLQYTNRREQKKNTISANLNSKSQHQYKLTKTPPNSNKHDHVNDYTEEYIESLEINKKQRHSGSAKERSSATVNGLGIHKSAATKINVPSANFGGKALRTANVGANSENVLPSHLPAHKTSQNTTGRMLDTLACVAGSGTSADKQPQLPSLANRQNTPSKSGTPSSKKRPSTTSVHTTIAPTALPTDKTPTATTTPVPFATTSSTTPVITTPRIAFANNYNTTVANGSNDGNSSYVNRPGSHSHNNSNNNNTLIESQADVDNKTFPSKINAENDDSSSTTSEVSIGQLSTTCLGADAVVKSRPKLEASRTYHVFHNEFSPSSTTTTTATNATNAHHQQPGQMLSVVWNPGKSAVVEKRQRSSQTMSNLTADMMTMAGPFRKSPRRPATQEGGYRAVEFVIKEFVQDAKPLNLRTTDVFRDVARMGAAGVCVSTGLKTNTIKPDLPSTFSLHGVPKKPQFEPLKKKKRASKTAVVRRKKEPPVPDIDGGRKSWSASTDASTHSNSGGGSSTMRLKPVHGDTNGQSNGSGPGGNGSTTLPVPYFKFWNSSLPPRSREGRRRGGHGGGGVGGDRMSADIDMQELAAMVLADESGNQDVDLTHAAKRVLEHKQKSDTEQGIATGSSRVTPPLDRTSKEELLESLRSVNQRPPKPTPRPLHLTYLTGDAPPSATHSCNSTLTHGNGNSPRNSQVQDRPPLPFHKQQLQQEQVRMHRKVKESDFHSASSRHDDAITVVVNSEHSREENAGNGVPSDYSHSDNSQNDAELPPTIISGNKGIDRLSGFESGHYVNGSGSTSTGSKRHQKTDTCVRPEIVFVSKLEGEEILSAAKEVNMSDDLNFMSRLSSWKQMCAEFNDKNSAFFIREAKNKKNKHLIAKKFDRKSSLSHQKRIKHLIERSRLQSPLGNAPRVPLMYSLGDMSDQRFFDIKSGINNMTLAKGSRGNDNNRCKYLENNEHDSSHVEHLKKREFDLKVVNIPSTTFMDLNCSATSGSSVSKEFMRKNSSEKAEDDANANPPYSDPNHCADDFHFHGNVPGGISEFGKQASGTGTRARKHASVHIVPCGIEPVASPEDSRSGRVCDENGDKTLSYHDHSNTHCDDIFRLRPSQSTVSKQRSFQEPMGNDKHSQCQENQPDFHNTNNNPVDNDDIDIRYKITKNASASHHDFDAGEGNCHDHYEAKERYSRREIDNGKLVVNNYTSSLQKYEGNKSNTKYHPTAEIIPKKVLGAEQVYVDNFQSKAYSYSNNYRPLIPLIYGTAMGQNHAVRGGHFRKKGHNHYNMSFDSPKPTVRLSPLSEPNIDLLAAKMSVKINMSNMTKIKMKYTKSREVGRSQSMHM